MRLLYDRFGAPVAYLAGALLYSLDDAPLGVVQDAQVVSPAGRHLGWFDGAFLRDAAGLVTAFAQGARGADGLELPPPQRRQGRLEPRPFAARPLLEPRERPAFAARWSEAAPLAALAEKPVRV